MPNVNTHNMQEEMHLIDIEQQQKENVSRKLIKGKFLFNTMHLVRYGGLKLLRGNNPLNFHVNLGQSCLGRVRYLGDPRYLVSM